MKWSEGGRAVGEKDLIKVRLMVMMTMTMMVMMAMTMMVVMTMTIMVVMMTPSPLLMSLVATSLRPS